MTAKKPIVNKGYILYEDYKFLFEFLNDEELGKCIRLLNNTYKEPTLNPTDNPNINNVYNYIANRIIDYTANHKFYSKSGKSGGNPALVKDKTLKGGDNPTVKLKDKKRKEKKLTVENIEFSLINEDFIDDTLKFKKMVEGAGRLSKNSNYDVWATQLRLLHQGVGDKQYTYALNWYSKKIGQPFIPECFSGDSFRSKWSQIVNQIQKEKENGR